MAGKQKKTTKADVKGKGKVKADPPANKASVKKPTTRKKKFEETYAQKLSKKVEAMRTNPPGVRIAESNLEANLAVMAGYLGVNNTSEYKEILHSSTIGRGAIQSYISSKLVKFGVPNGKTSYPIKGIFESLTDPDCVTWYDQKLPLSGTVEGDERGYRSTVRSMHQIIIGAPQPSSRSEVTVARLLGYPWVKSMRGAVLL